MARPPRRVKLGIYDIFPKGLAGGRAQLFRFARRIFLGAAFLDQPTHQIETS